MNHRIGSLIEEPNQDWTNEKGRVGLMKPRRFVYRSLLAALLALAVNLIIAAPGLAKQTQAVANIRIKNFGQLDERFFRGAQPKESDYKDLAAMGINTIIDLRDDPTSYEARDVEAAGMRY